MQSNRSTAVSTKQPLNPRLCAYAACGREFVPTNGRQNYCKPECKQKARNALALDKYHKKRELLEAGNKKQREEAAQIALQTVHDCPKCRKVLHRLFLKHPAAIDLYKRDVEADRADRRIAIQEENPCQCCHLAPVARAHGNSKLCIPCGVVHRGESKREGTRRHRARQRGDAPVEEERRCKGCGEILEPDPDTGRIDPRRQYCDRCAEERNLDAKIGWKKKKRAEARAKAGHVCPGLKIDEDERISPRDLLMVPRKTILQTWIRPCGLWVVPKKTMHQKYCSKECEVLTNRIHSSLDPERRKYYRDYARNLKKRALPADLGSKPETWRKTVPILMVYQFMGKTLTNSEALKLAGVKVQVSKQTMNRMRDYCNVPGPKGRPRRTL